MSHGRHSYIAFYASDWLAGTARMTRLHKSVYFDICSYIWDQAKPCPETELPLMLGDLPDWEKYVNDLILAGKLDRDSDGSLTNSRAMDEAQKAFDLWEKKSKGGKRGAAKTNTPASTPVESPDDTPASTDDGTGPGVPTQNQNQNLKDRVDKSTPADAGEEYQNLLKTVWETTLPWLEDKMGKPCNGIIGGWLKKHRAERIIAACTAAQLCQAPIDNHTAWITEWLASREHLADGYEDEDGLEGWQRKVRRRLAKTRGEERAGEVYDAYCQREQWAVDIFLTIDRDMKDKAA